MHEVDFAEEVAIGYGYKNLPVELYEGGVGKYHPLVQLQDSVRTIMIGSGYLETMNFIITSKDNYTALKLPFDKKNNIIIENPISKEWMNLKSL